MIIEQRKAIFVSYTGDDQHIAQEVVERMRDKDLDPFFAPQDIPHGTAWQTELYAQLRFASAVVAIFTPRSITNSWVLAECSAAWILGIPVFSFVMFTPLSQLPAFASTIQARIIETPNQLDAAIEQVKEQLSKYSLRTDSWTHIAAAIAAVDQKLRDEFVPTDIVVGIGRGGAVCGAVIASRRGISLKVCDLKKGKSCEVDLSSLQSSEFLHRHVLVVEYYRNTGKTFSQVQIALQKQKIASICSVAVICRKGQENKVDFIVEKVEDFVRPPWQTAF